MFDRFTPDAKRTTVVAQERANRSGDDHIGPGHLIAAAAEVDGIAQQIIVICGGDPEALAPPLAAKRGGVEHLPFTPPAKKALEMALRESLRLKHAGISGAHILVGALVVSDDGPAHDYLTSCSITVDQLREALAGIPVIEAADRGTPDEVRDVAIETLKGLVVNEEDLAVRDQIAHRLVSSQISALRVRDALETATAQARSASRGKWAVHMVAIAELGGDINAVIRHGQEAMTLSDDPLPAVRGSLALAYAQRGESAEAWSELRHLVPDGGMTKILTIEAAESYLLLGETERAAQTLAVAGEPEDAIAVAWHALVQAQLGRAGVSPRLSRSQIESVLTGPEHSVQFWIEARLRVEALHAGLATGTPRKVAKEAGKLAAEARGLGLGGVLSDSLEVQAIAMVKQGSRKSAKSVNLALTEAERLGRTKQADRIRSLQ